MGKRWLAPAGLAAAALVAVGCGSSGSSSAPSSSPSASPTHTGAQTSTNALKTATVSGVKVVTNAKGFTLYQFAPDTTTTSKCNGSCTGIWPPVKGPATAGTGVTGTLGTIMRSDGSAQATYKGHPLYTYTGDTSPGQNTGNGINSFGGIWHEVTVSGAAPAGSSTSGGGFGY